MSTECADLCKKETMTHSLCSQLYCQLIHIPLFLFRQGVILIILIKKSVKQNKIQQIVVKQISGGNCGIC